MTTNQQPNLDPDFELNDEVISGKETINETQALEDQNYIVKQLNGLSLEDSYDKPIDYSSEDGKKIFEVLKPMVALQNLVFIPVLAYKKFIDQDIDREKLNQIIFQTHEKLGLNQPVFKENTKKTQQNDFVVDADKLAPTQTGAKIANDAQPTTESGLKNKEAVKAKPSDIQNGFQEQVAHKINALEHYKSKVEATKGRISLKKISVAAGLFYLGTVFNPIGALAIPAAILIGGYAIAQSLFSRNPEIKNYDKQIDILKEATATIILSADGSHTNKSEVQNIKGKKTLLTTLYDERIEAEFARLCFKKNVNINHDIFKTAYQYSEGYKIEHNRTVLKNKNTP